MSIPKNISRNHVLRAIEDIDKNGVPKKRKSRTWFLEYKNKKYPPKYVITLANKYANGRSLKPSEFIAHEAVNYLRKLEFQVGKIGHNYVTKRSDLVKPSVNSKMYPQSEFDREMHSIFEEFASLVEKRFRAIIKRHAELEEIYQESEDTIRYMMFYSLTTAGINPLDVYLEYPHSDVPNKNHAKLDALVAPKDDRPKMIFEIKFQKKIGENIVPKPNNAGAVFADILKLALFRGKRGRIKRYFVYVADEHMLYYLNNHSHRYNPFIELEEDMGFNVTRAYLTKKPAIFVKQLRKIVERESFPEPTVICRFRKNLEVGKKEMAIRVYEIVP